MDGRTCPEGMSPEQFAEAQRITEITEQALAGRAVADGLFAGVQEEWRNAGRHRVSAA